MRYIGSKTATLPAIQAVISTHAPEATSLCDPFAGTCTVARHFKTLGMRIETGDLLWCSHAFQTATIALNRVPAFAMLAPALTNRGLAGPPEPTTAQRVVNWLNKLPACSGFITANFSDAGAERRRFFTASNASRIDAIRQQIADWSADGLIDEAEQAYLIACLLDAADRVANTAGTYMANLKSWGRKALKPLDIRAIVPFDNGAINGCSRADARQTALAEVDVLYLDPPYNTRDYSFYYHLPETLVLWDGAPPRGKSGVPATRRHPISDFCVRRLAASALDGLIARSAAGLIVVHYTTTGLIRHEEILAMLGQRGDPAFIDLQVRSYRSRIDSGPGFAHHRIYWCRTT